MSLSTNIADLATRIATEFNAVRTTVGALTNLTTTNKTSIVNAINEVRGLAAASQIDDASTSTTTSWSSSKTSQSITDSATSVKNDILGGAGAAYDTLQELRQLLTDSDTADDAALAAINTALGNRVRFDAAQTLTGPQQVQARANIDAASATDVGSTTTNYVTAFETALA